MTAVKKAPRKAAKKAGTKAAMPADGEAAVLEKIAAMPGSNRAVGERLHQIITASAPEVAPKLYFGLPGYAKGGKIVCFFRSTHTFKERYMTVGFTDKANLDDGNLWPVYFALKQLTASEEAMIAALVKKAVSGGTPA